MKLLVIFPIILAILATCHAKEKIPIDIFIEFSCPYSKDFITTQLAKAYNQIKDDFDLNFYPLGKSSSYEGANGEVAFHCQHGPDECEGNKLQVCGLNLIGNENEAKQVDFLVCTMTNEKTFEGCCEDLALSYHDIKACSNSEEGTKLLLDVEKATVPVLARYNHVPQIIFNSKFDENDLTAALLDFAGLCSRKLEEN